MSKRAIIWSVVAVAAVGALAALGVFAYHIIYMLSHMH